MASTGTLPEKLNLTLDPSTWWMTGGTVAPVTASWSDVPPDCTVVPLWYRWSIAPGGSEGYLEPTNRSSTNFTAVGTRSGSTVVDVASSAALDCGSNRTAYFATATATFHVDAPLALQELRTVIPGTSTNGSVAIDGMLVGGEPPFTLGVAWGNGNSTTRADAADGNFSVVGIPGGGRLDPSVTATDAAGLIAHGTVEENISWSRSFEISIDPSSYIADVGVPISFRLQSSAPPGNYSLITVCEDATGERPATANAPRTGFSCTFATPGLANVSAMAVQGGFPFATASAQLWEPVVPKLSVAAGPIPTVAELGRESYVPLTLTGGVPPFRVHWRFVGNGSEASTSIASDGTFLAPVIPVVEGSEQLAVEAVDALGVPAANASATVEVDGPVAAEAAANGDLAPGGTEIAVSATVLGGAPPFEWSVVAIPAATNGTSEGGALPSAGAIAWTGTLRAEGLQALTVVIVDATGAIWRSNLSVDTVTPLKISLRAFGDGPGRWAGQLDIWGGVPPFLAWVNSSDGHSWNQSGLVDGPWNFSTRAYRPGNLSVSVVVVDRLGIAARSSARVAIMPSSKGPPGSSWELASAITVLILLGGAAVIWRKRRSNRPAGPPAVDPIETLRAIIAPADGADRAVVELLAEEQGIPIASVRSSIDRLVADGTIRAERGADGEEVLAWRNPP